MEELGSGFYLAMHDLEIRGAGEVLGDNQSGNMMEVGFQLYNDMLAEAVRSVAWPKDVSSFGWFAAEASAAKTIREYWRDTLGLGRDQTLAAAYWRRGAAGLMAG